MENWKFRPNTLVTKNKDLSNSVINELYLEGIIMRACDEHELSYPNAFMYRNEKEAEKPWGKYKKIQNRVFFNAFSKVCRNLCISTRNGINIDTKINCIESDATAAEFILENYSENVTEYKIIRDICHYSNNDGKQNGISYMCPFIGYDEIAFPVYLYDRPMGVLIVGQIPLERHRESYYKKIEKIYENQDFSESIDELKNSFKPVNNLEDIVDKVKAAVADIEKELIGSFESRQNRYVNKESRHLIEFFRNKLEENDFSTKASNTKDVFPAEKYCDKYDKLGKIVNDVMKEFCKNIGVDEYTVFVPESKNLIDNDYTVLTNDALKLHTDNHESGIKPYYCNDLYKYIDGDLYNLNFMLLSDISAVPTYPIALVINRNPAFENVNNSEEKDWLKNNLKSIFDSVVSYIQLIGTEIKSDYFRVYLENSMSITRHELGQSSSGNKILIEKFKQARNNQGELYSTYKLDKNLQKILNNFLDNCDICIENFESFLYTSEIRINASKYLIDFSNKENWCYFYPYEKFLFKWSIIFKDYAKEMKLRFSFPLIEHSDKTRPMMYGDPNMIEQAAYNLTYNAFKYALNGTEIYFDCKLNNDKSKYEIIVKNLAHSFNENNTHDESEKIFEYGKRGSNNEKEGSGLGLYLTKKIAQAHGGDVECITKKISDYDISLIDLYIKYFDENKKSCSDKKIYEEIKQEIIDIEDDYIISPLPENAFTPLYVNGNICKGTTEFTFIFWVPYVK